LRCAKIDRLILSDRSKKEKMDHQQDEEGCQCELFGQTIRLPSLFSTQLIWFVGSIEAVSAGSSGLEVMTRRMTCQNFGYLSFLKLAKIFRYYQLLVAPLLPIITIITTKSDTAVRGFTAFVAFLFAVAILFDIVLIYTLFIPGVVTFGKLPFFRFDDAGRVPRNLTNVFVDVSRITRSANATSYAADVNLGQGQSIPVSSFIAEYFQSKGSTKIMLYNSRYLYRAIANTVPFIAWDFYPLIFSLLVVSNGRSVKDIIGWIFFAFFLCLLIHMTILVGCILITFSKMVLPCFPAEEDFTRVVLEHEGGVAPVATINSNPLNATPYSPPPAVNSGVKSESKVPIATPV
jgi:hypothetical protein